MTVRRNAPQGSPSRATGRRSVAASLHVNQRTLQCALGAIWIIDGLLKFQPDLFKPSFVSDVIRPMAAGQPSLINSTINHTANLLSHGTTLWVALFGVIEIAIGVGLFFRRSVKPALVASFIWGAGIYLFGEGFGMVLTGQTSPLQGAPGAVCFYMLLGLLVWPRADQGDDRQRVGPASSAAGRGVLGGTGSLLVWAGIWLFEAVIWVFPFNRTSNSITNQLTETANGEPGWYAHFLNATGHAFAGTGIWMAALLATVSVIIGLGPLISRRAGIYIGLGIALALLYWVTGEGVGELLTFGGTDPNNGPLIALIGLSVLPLVPEPADEPTPAARFLAVNPLGALGALLAVILIPSVVAVIPACGVLSRGLLVIVDVGSMSGMSMSGSSSSMKGMSMSSSGKSSTSGSHAGAMNMSAMAGLGVTDPNWKYTGPALPAAEVANLTTVSARTDDGHKMQTPDCDAKPTSEQVLGATAVRAGDVRRGGQVPEPERGRRRRLLPDHEPQLSGRPLLEPVLHEHEGHHEPHDGGLPRLRDHALRPGARGGHVPDAGPGQRPHALWLPGAVAPAHQPLHVRHRRIRSTGSRRAHPARTTTARPR